MILTKKAIESVSLKLDLPFKGIEQDWEVELADSKRVKEFVSFYKGLSLSLDEKMALMALILASYDDYLEENDIGKNEFWDEIRFLLRSEEELFRELLNYWSLDGEIDPENYFKITPLARSIRDSYREGN